MANFLQKLFGLNDETTISGCSGLPAGLAMARHRAEQNGDTEAVQAIDNGTYKELLEKRADDSRPTIAPGIDYYTYNIAGINFRKGIAAYVGRSVGYLKQQPTNRHDPNAIAVYAEDGNHLGYIPADETDDVRALRLRFPIPVSVDIEECYDDDGRRFFVGEVTIKVKAKE
jgi:hypothetical protein